MIVEIQLTGTELVWWTRNSSHHPNQNSVVYWVGDRTCGWDSCTLNIPTALAREKTDPIDAQYVNVGIPCPWYLYNGDVIEVCGIAQCTGADSSNLFGCAIGRFSCADAASIDPVTVTHLADTSEAFSNATGVVCFNTSYTIGDTLEPCDTLFVLGFNTTNLSIGGTVKFSYTFKVTRGCTS